MYLRWIGNDKGTIFFSKPGLKDFVESRLYKGAICRDIATDNNQLVVSLVTSENSFYLDKLRLSDDLVKSLNSMGIEAVVSWIQGEDERENDESALFERPIFWAVVGTAISATFFMGIARTVLCLVAGGAFYGVAAFLSSESGQDVRGSLLKIIKEILD